MNMPFGLPVVKEIGIRKRDDQGEATAHYARKLSEYREALEIYRKCILEYSQKLEGYDRRSIDNQLSIVQTALDLTYIKEQEDKIFESLEEMKQGTFAKTLSQMESLLSAILDTNYKLDALDTNVVNRLSELLLELQKQTMLQTKQMETEVAANLEKLTKSVKKGHGLLWFLVVFNILGLGGLAFVILYVLEIIPL